MTTSPLLLLRFLGVGLGVLGTARAGLDLNGDLVGDIWQGYYQAHGLAPQVDTDGDGFTNAQESVLGTDPRDPASNLAVSPGVWRDGWWSVSWPARRDKRYVVETSPDLVTWTTAKAVRGADEEKSETLAGEGGRLFVRLRAEELDTDGDGLSDWEERRVGLNPERMFSEGLGSNPTTPTTSNPRITDRERLATLMGVSVPVVTLVAMDDAMAENWPDPGVVVVRRSGGVAPLTVNLNLGGTAVAGVDYAEPMSGAVVIPYGADEAVLRLLPLEDDLIEGRELVVVSVAAGAGYTVGSPGLATLRLEDGADGRPAEKAAARFLTQATFGPEPVELARVREAGFAGWLDAQFERPVNLHLPLLHTWQIELGGTTNSPRVSSDHRLEAWWRQAMRTDEQSDPLRQRVAFALSQIFVISDRMSSLANDQRGMASYQDVLLTHAFGRYRDLLEAVTRHPWMGLYLSALRNRKANPAINRFPDENYAREVMQLFSIGLWLLNPDGSPRLSDGTELDPYGVVVPAGRPIATYGEGQIGELARVFTGLSYSRRFTSSTNLAEIPTTRFSDSVNIPWHPMRMWDVEHDVGAKTLWLPGNAPLQLPARVASASPDTGAAGDADLAAALDYLSNHPNVGPFIGRQLIQRLVTSNPTPGYVARIAAVFADNGAGVRGDLRAVVRAILLDPEARDPARLDEPAQGLVREPYTRFVAMARAFGAAPADVSAGGRYRGFSSLDADLLQRPLSAPSVFNYYSPDYLPPGRMAELGLVAPELQIVNSVTAITGPNRFSSALAVTSTTGFTQLNPSRQSDNLATPEVDEGLWNTRVDEAAWLPLTHGAPEVLVRALDRALCAGTMTPGTFRAVCRAVARLNDPAAAGLSDADRLGRERQRFRVAAHLVLISADAAVLK